MLFQCSSNALRTPTDAPRILFGLVKREIPPQKGQKFPEKRMGRPKLSPTEDKKTILGTSHSPENSDALRF